LTADLSELAPTQEDPTAHKLFPTDEWKDSFVEKFRNYRQVGTFPRVTLRRENSSCLFQNLRSAMIQAKKRLGTSAKEQEKMPNLQQPAWWEYISGIEPAHSKEPSEEGEASKTAEGVEGSILENGPSTNDTQCGHEPGLSILRRMTTVSPYLHL
jgi:hypothetical protein